MNDTQDSSEIPPDRLESLRAIKAGIDENDTAPDAWVEYSDDPEGVTIECEIAPTNIAERSEIVGTLIGEYVAHASGDWIPPVATLKIGEPAEGERYIIPVRRNFVTACHRHAGEPVVDWMVGGLVVNRQEVGHGV